MATEVVCKFRMGLEHSAQEVVDAIWETVGISVDPETVRSVGDGGIFFVPITSASLADFFTRNLAEKYPSMRWEERIRKPVTVESVTVRLPGPVQDTDWSQVTDSSKKLRG